jgi:4-hydroxy-tetrahydrodipicolinate synthase
MFRGVGTAIVTPFLDEKIDLKSYEKLVNLQIENDVSAIFVLGTTGESPSIDQDESAKLITKTVELCDGRVEIIAGAGTNSTKKTVELVKNAEKYGASGVLVVTPYYNKPTQKGLYEHYKYISERTSSEIVIYNVPGRTGVNILPETVYKIASDCKNVRGLKEANTDINQVDKDLISLKRSSPDFRIYSGNDDSAFHLLCSGGDGIVSVASNIIPQQMAKMCDLVFKDDIESAREIHLKFFDLFKVLFVESNPIPVKAALWIKGLIHDELRLPLVPASESTVNLLKNVMKECDLI